MSPDDLPAFLSAIRDKAAKAAPPAVMGMADAYRSRVSRVTLRQYSHPYGAKTDSPPGQPPAWVLGALARSVTAVLGASSGTDAHADVSPHTVYARIQEVGGTIRPVHRRFLRFVQDGEVVYAKRVTLPPRPYMAPTTRDMIQDGSLTMAAADAFTIAVWG